VRLAARAEPCPLRDALQSATLDETLAALSAAEPNDDQAEMLTRGMENLVGLFGNVLSGLGEERH